MLLNFKLNTKKSVEITALFFIKTNRLFAPASMKKLTRLSYFVLCVALCIFILACKKKTKSPEDSSTTAFDKQGMLVNYADNLIIPAYAAFKTSFDSLNAGYETFKSNRSLGAFQDLKLRLFNAYSRYQGISPFGLGPAEDQGIRASFNVFPANANLIESNINSGNYNLAQVSNLAAKGFPALDYIFFGSADENKQYRLLDSLEKRRAYVSAVLSEMKLKLDATYSGWTGTYRNQFVNSLGTDIGSSIGLLINQLNYELDYLKNAKLGIPLGLKSGGTLLPDNCEAYYSKQSLSYLVGTFNCIERIYLGQSAKGEDGKGFDDYVAHLGIKHLDQDLNTAIKTQFEATRSKIKFLTNPLSDQIVNNYAPVKEVYNELVKLLVLLKTDLPSGLGVVITYQDGDGD